MRTHGSQDEVTHSSANPHAASLRARRPLGRALALAALAVTLLAGAALTGGCSDDDTLVVVRSPVAARLAAPTVVDGNVVLFYRLLGETVSRADVRVEFSADGKRSWTVATEAVGVSGSEGLTDLLVGPAPGVGHTFTWTGFPEGADVVVSVTPLSAGLLGVPDEFALTTPVQADALEPNDTSNDARAVTAGATVALTIGPDGTDRDFFSLASVTFAAVVDVTIAFDGDISDLDLFVDEQGGAALGSSETTGSVETVRVFAPAGAALVISTESFNSRAITYALTVSRTAVTVDYEETFDAFGSVADLLAAGWTVDDFAGNGPIWEVGAPSGVVGPGFAVSGSTVVATILGDVYPDDAEEEIVTPTVTASTGDVFVVFDAFVETEGGGFDYLEVYSEVNGSGSFDLLATLEGDLTLFGGYRRFVIEGPPGMSAGDDIRITLYFASDVSDGGAGVYIDDLRIVTAP